MSFQSGGGIPHFLQGQNPKSILSDRTHNNQQSIISSSNNPPTASALIRGLNNDTTNNVSNLRVTFAKAATLTKHPAATSGTNIINNGPARVGSFLSKVKGRTTATAANKYNFGLFPKGKEQLALEQTKKAAEESLKSKATETSGGGGGAGEEIGKSSKWPRKLAKNISILYPADKFKKPKTVKSTSGGASSTGVLLSTRGSKSEESSLAVVVDSRSTTAKSKSSVKGTVRAKSSKGSGTIPSRRVKSGKKLSKKKKKSKQNQQQQDSDLDSIKPAKLSDEYASELNKITQILKAVSAFDESTGTDNAIIRDGSLLASRNNFVTSYTYTAASEASRRASSGQTTTTTAGAATVPLRTTESLLRKQLINSPQSTLIRRPLSGDELKQLLSSITRVVSLHQLPIDAADLLTTAAAAAAASTTATEKKEETSTTLEDFIAATSASLNESASASAAAGTTKKGKKKTKKSSRKSLLRSAATTSKLESSSDLLLHITPTTTAVVGTTKKTTKKTKSKSTTKKALSTKSKSKSSPASASASASASTSIAKAKSTPPPRKLSKPKHNKIGGRPHYMKPKKTHSDNSVSSTEKDPVKNALFLRKYFEESIRLANRKSSEEVNIGKGVEESSATAAAGATNANAANDDNNKKGTTAASTTKASKSKLTTNNTTITKNSKPKKKKQRSSSVSVSNKVSSKTV